MEICPAANALFKSSILCCPDRMLAYALQEVFKAEAFSYHCCKLDFRFWVLSSIKALEYSY